MKLSIGITCYNYKDYVRNAIESALNQTIPCEVIVVDDGSTDGSRFVVDEYADKVTVVHQTNRGLPAARNTAFMHSTGDYFLPLDADDILEPKCAERILKVAEDTNADVIAPSFITFGSTEQTMILGMRPTLEDFKTGNRIAYCSAIKRSVFLECGGYSPRMYWGYEDYAMWFDLLRRGKTIVTIPEPLWRYCTKPNSMITVAQQHHQELMNQIAKDNPGLF